MSMKINLLPKEYRPQAAVNLPRLLFMLFTAISVFGLGIWLTSEWMTLKQIEGEFIEVNQSLELYGQQYQSVKMLEEQKAQIDKKNKEINTIMQPFIPIETVMNEIILPLPDKLWFKSLEIDETGHIVLGAKTDRMNAIALYMIDIEASPLFTNTKVEKIENSNTDGSGDIFGFKLDFDIEKAGLVQ